MESDSWDIDDTADFSILLQMEEWGQEQRRRMESELNLEQDEVAQRMEEGWRQEERRRTESETLLAQDEVARRLERSLQRGQERVKAAGRSFKSHEMPHYSRPATADRRLKQELQVHNYLNSGEQRQHSAKLAREHQVRQDEELAWTLIQQDLEWNELDYRNIVKSQGTLDRPAAAADRRDKQELQFHNSLSEESMQHSEKPVREQQLARPMEHGSFSSEDPVHDLFFAVSIDNRGFVGVGCIIKDADGQVVSQNRKCIGLDIGHHLAEYSVLISGLKIAQLLGLRRINAHGNPGFIYWEVQRQVEVLWTVEQLNALEKQIKELDSFTLNCVSCAENEEATKLANYAAEHAPTIKRTSDDMELEDARKECLICLEKIFPPDIVSLNDCGHRFCFNCLSQHVETEISARKVPVRCPLFTDSCAVNLDNNACQRLVSPKVFDTYLTRLTEAAIPDSEKVYCPFPGCSAMMCRTDGNETNRYAASSSTSTAPRTNIGCSECVECHRLFCVECHVPWHADLACRQFQELPPDERDPDDRKLFQLAKDQKWRKCEKCHSLIILAEGCFHITCRCGNEFCYTCGANYRGKRKMCTCPLFNEPSHEAQIPHEWWRVQPPIPAFYRARIRDERIFPRAPHRVRIPLERSPPVLRFPPELTPPPPGFPEILRAYHRERVQEERIPEERIRTEGRIPGATNRARIPEERFPGGTIPRETYLARIPGERIPEDGIPRASHRARIPPERIRKVRFLEHSMLEERSPEARIRQERMPNLRFLEERSPEARIRQERMPNLSFLEERILVQERSFRPPRNWIP